MLGFLLMASAITIMVKVADMEGRSGLIWGVYTFVLFLVMEGLLSSVLGAVAVFFSGLGALVLSYGTMFVLKVVGEG